MPLRALTAATRLPTPWNAHHAAHRGAGRGGAERGEAEARRGEAAEDPREAGGAAQGEGGPPPGAAGAARVVARVGRRGAPRRGA